MSTITTARGYRLGTDITATTSAAEALTVAGLDWDVTLRSADSFMLMDEDGLTSTSMPGFRFAVRSDNGVSLAAVGGKYHVVSNQDAFAIGDSLVDAGARRVSAGALDFGRRVFMEFDFPQYSVGLASGKDLVTFGARIKTSHDGSGKVRAEIVGKRLWCTNGCTVTIKGLPHVFEVGHTASAQEKLAQASTIMEGAGAYVAAFSGAAERLLHTRMTEHEFGLYVDALFPRPVDGSAKSKLTRWETQRAELFQLYKFADTNELGRDTRWGAFNAVTEYLDWGSTVHTSPRAGTVEQARALRQFDNANQAARDAAWTFALAA